MKKSKYILLGKTIACIFSIIITALLANPASFFGQTAVARAAQPPFLEGPAMPAPAPPKSERGDGCDGTLPEVSAPPPNNIIIPNGVEVITSQINLRQGPGTNCSIIKTLKAGDILTITNLSRNLYWIEVITSDGQTGWVSALPELVSLNPSLDKQLVPSESFLTQTLSLTKPILLESRSLDGKEFGLTQFEWQWDGQLAEDQGFEVRVWREGEQPLGIHDAVSDNKNGNIQALDNHTYRLIVDIHDAPGVKRKESGKYLWTVLLVQISPKYQKLGIQAEPAPLGEIFAEAAFAIAAPPPIEEGPAEAALEIAAPAPPCGEAAESKADYCIVEVFYGTDRKMTGPSDPDNPGDNYGTTPDSLTYGIAKVSIPRDHRLGWFESPPPIAGFIFREDPKKHIVLVSADQVRDEAFFTALGSTIQASTEKQAFVFVHGFNVTFKDAVRQTAQLAYDLQFFKKGAPILYSWPSQGALFGYGADEKNVELSAPHLKTFLENIAQRTGATTIYVIAHSMGNRALTEALRLMGRDSSSDTRTFFHEIMLAAPDITTTYFTDTLAPPLRSGYPGARVTLYASARDEALLLSMMIHQASRVGYIWGNPLILEGMDTIDVTEVNSSLFGHSYYRDNCAVLSDIFGLLNGELPPSERVNLAKIESLNGIYWAFHLLKPCKEIIKE